jgi:hypothetical protein
MTTRATRHISWPPALRAMSFAITLAVVSLESMMAFLPIAIGLWFFGVASATVIETGAIFTVIVALAIAISSHLKPTRLDRRAFKENAA